MSGVFLTIAEATPSWADEGEDFPALSATKVAAKTIKVDPKVAVKVPEVDTKVAAKTIEVDTKVAAKTIEVDPKSAAVVSSEAGSDAEDDDEELRLKLEALTKQHKADKERKKTEEIRLVKLEETRKIVKQLKSENVIDGETISKLLITVEEKNQRIALIIKENPELADGGVGGAASAEPLTATPVKTAASTPTQASASAKAASTEEWKDVSSKSKHAAVQLVDVDKQEVFNYDVSAVHNFRDVLGMDNYCFATLMMQVGEFVAVKDNFDWVKKGCVWKGCKMHLSHGITISRITKMFTQKTIVGNVNKRKLIQQFRYMLNNYDFADFNGFFENGKFVEDINMQELWHESAQRVSDMLATL